MRFRSGGKGKYYQLEVFESESIRPIEVSISSALTP
jgi:hypothetical protein